ncbi:MAG: TOBE domain-containing protein, partial [Cyanobacteria bacterium P01_H01_bin.130]
EQLDRPEVLYWEPASQFVAAFVVQMNFIRGRHQSEGWETELGAFTGEVTSAALDTLPPALTIGMERILGVRQDNLRVQESGDDRPANGRILSREFLGRDYRYTLELRPHPNFATDSPKVLQALVPLGDRTAGPFDIGDRVNITLGDAPLQGFPKP